MKQPELGKKISDLRKSKGLTQEELVELCNISVRTIQRIETGEVTPRSYTVKTILAALDYGFTDIQIQEHSISAGNLKWLKHAWIGAIIYFLFGIPEGALDMYRGIDEWEFWSEPGVRIAYAIVKFFALSAFLFFMQGFTQIGSALNRPLLKFASIGFMIYMVMMISYDLITLLFSDFDWMELAMLTAIPYGVFTIGFGLALVQIREQISRACLAAGGLLVFGGMFFLFMLPIGFFFTLPAELILAYILYKSVSILENPDDE